MATSDNGVGGRWAVGHGGYQGDGDFPKATSNGVSQLVTQDGTTTVLTSTVLLQSRSVRLVLGHGECRRAAAARHRLGCVPGRLDGHRLCHAPRRFGGVHDLQSRARYSYDQGNLCWRRPFHRQHIDCHRRSVQQDSTNTILTSSVDPTLLPDGNLLSQCCPGRPGGGTPTGSVKFMNGKKVLVRSRSKAAKPYSRPRS